MKRPTWPKGDLIVEYIWLDKRIGLMHVATELMKFFDTIKATLHNTLTYEA